MMKEKFDEIRAALDATHESEPIEATVKAAAIAAIDVIENITESLSVIAASAKRIECTSRPAGVGGVDDAADVSKENGKPQRFICIDDKTLPISNRRAEELLELGLVYECGDGHDLHIDASHPLQGTHILALAVAEGMAAAALGTFDDRGPAEWTGVKR